ncbi:hypothetical protein DID88_004548 [Monilinia fructigena]|uniref:Uncharacterized protein n=1 Tax=Monilinia fructigena TaxID=38457 RepID=A0A395IQV7_9HELO|nr:hypothetical protein DID88_004548 [Monilinia fructigena]
MHFHLHTITTTINMCFFSTSANLSVVTTSGATFDNIAPKNTVQARPVSKCLSSVKVKLSTQQGGGRANVFFSRFKLFS